MGLFRRNRTLPPPAVGAPFPLPQNSGLAGTAGWRGLYPVHASDQIGAYAGSLLNQTPAMVPGVQLHSGREWGCSWWYTPQISYLPNGSVQETQVPNNLPGGQRYGSTFTGPIGPVNAKQNAARVTAAQIRQSGLAAVGWARGLSE